LASKGSKLSAETRARRARLKPAENASPTKLSIADELLKLAKLKEQGILTEEEFTKMKSVLINKM